MNIRKAHISFVLILIMLFSFSGISSAAGTTLEKVKEKGVITVGNSPDYPPFESIGDNGERVGFDIDLLDAVAQKIGVKVQWVTMEFAAIVTAVQSGQVDMGMSGFSITPERREQVGFSAPYFASGQVIVTRPDSDIKNVADLNGKKIAVQLGTTGEQQADKIEGASVIKPESYSIAFMMLHNNAADAVIADLSVADEYMKNGTFKKAGEPLSFEEFAMISRKGNEDLLAALNAALDAVKKDGTYDAIVKKWNF
ncbi:basic amino acid ABC transporter substrate-binding protein [Pseudodesulfovibrio piezophilus]|uniref:Extracellular solute-binding protein family 3 n=1 Tax=Pseudodesulfovibrio piezophilus (strain DSM 21447 / JCM 15486 / C1TLV30) TaxID=1322246 RepID=M1WJ89_PSEP2|nr:basic amino acid ABC transporter substrate-binding protein [Pseudodesulfovibrio piezophilus]CCH47476.1 Extracellular solute-binding protein family 3 [Pseudodesulfovibrio piezophilus C1TLV30]